MAYRPTDQERSEIRKNGEEIFDRVIKPGLTQHDDNKFVAIDTLSQEFEIDDDDDVAIRRLRGRLPKTLIWLRRVGHRAAYRLVSLKDPK